MWVDWCVINSRKAKKVTKQYVNCTVCNFFQISVDKKYKPKPVLLWRGAVDTSREV